MLEINYEFDPEKIIEQTNMGVVLKRRDNSKIVKEIFQGVINVIMSTNDLYKAREFYINSCKRLLKGEIRLDYLVTSKSLAATYKNPNAIPHRVLADRIALETQVINQHQMIEYRMFMLIEMN